MSTRGKDYSNLPERHISRADLPEVYKSPDDLPEIWKSPDDLPEVYVSRNETLEVVRKSEEKEVVRTRENDAPERYNSGQKEVAVARTREDDGPEPFNSGEKELARAREDDAPETNDSDPALKEEQSNASPARRRRRWILAIAAAIVIALALGVGLGVGLSQSGGSDGSDAGDVSEAGRGDTPQESPTAEAPSPRSEFSTRGAFNGSDIAVNSEARMSSDGTLSVEDDYNNALLFYQHYNGEIRWMQHIVPDTFYGGSVDEVVATDAKNRTDIDMVNRGGSELQVHVFYIGRDNTVKQRVKSNTSLEWYDGPLNALNYEALDSPRVALRAGRYAANSTAINATNEDAPSCLKLFVGTSETQIDELTQCPGANWSAEAPWTDVNGRADPAYQGWTSDSVTYVAMVDSDNNGKFYWRDYRQGSSVANTAEHPLNQWTRATRTNIKRVDPAAGLTGLSEYGTLARRDATDGSMVIYYVVLNAESSSVSLTDAPIFQPLEMRGGSQLEVVTSPFNPPTYVLYYQTADNNITMSSGNMRDSPSNTTTWPVPDE